MTQQKIKQEKIIVTFFIFVMMLVEASLLLWTGALELERILFYLALFIYQIRFLYLNWIVKPNRLTFQASSSQKKPLLMDYTLNFLFFIIFPMGYTYLHETFYANWNLGRTVQVIIFSLYVIGTLITLVSEAQRKHVKQQNPTLNYRFYGLFKYAICINYFGEILALPSLFYLASGSIIIFILMLLQQVLDFVFVQIPRQESYIKEHYPDEAGKILSQKKLIPFIY
ncbi:hypothetical protein [Vagococcus silagei]|uniref:DUF1295 domain-containing protein n=1 Tax=Vagococcus silagei TaxID=2508885 RepID=A0A4S3B2S3_9ENTE|nr:hypothetical protein [Vagococcus silagei]THB61122.1 hypothetical protein ESZ54_07245 [Vagococcus silagei]